MTVQLWVQLIHLGNSSYSASTPFTSAPIVLTDAEGRQFQTGITGELVTESRSASEFFEGFFYSIESAYFAINAISTNPPPDPGAQASFTDLNGNIRRFQQWQQISLPDDYQPIIQSTGRGYPFPISSVVIENEDGTSVAVTGVAFPGPELETLPRTVIGTPLDDVLYGKNGDDLIRALEGNDRAFGLLGNDQLFGGDDADDLYGGPGLDGLYGGAGNDFLAGGSARDMLYGGSGSDDANGGGGDDVIYGGGGNDNLNGGEGVDLIYGGAEADRITGGAGDDQIFAGAGNDLITGGGGNDVITGGGGPDTYVIEGDGTSFDTILDYEAQDVIIIPGDILAMTEVVGGSTFIRQAEGGSLLAVLQGYSGSVNVQIKPEEPEMEMEMETEMGFDLG